jgi:SAM-dependent methyltransferase
VKTLTAPSPSGLSLLIESVLRRGWRETARGLAEDRSYDRARGVTTAERVPVMRLDGLSRHQRYHSSEYQPVPVRLFRAAIAAVPEAARRGAFVDLGCGKGRALVLAAEHGYRHLVGIEQSTALALEAERNLRVFADRAGLDLDVRIVQGDAAEHRFGGEDSTIFLFHPFSRRVLRRVLLNLASVASASAGTAPAVALVYVNPMHGGVIAESQVLREVAVGRTRIPGVLDWAVWARMW